MFRHRAISHWRPPIRNNTYLKTISHPVIFHKSSVKQYCLETLKRKKLNPKPMSSIYRWFVYTFQQDAQDILSHQKGDCKDVEISWRVLGLPDSPFPWTGMAMSLTSVVLLEVLGVREVWSGWRMNKARGFSRGMNIKSALGVVSTSSASLKNDTCKPSTVIRTLQ
jgi:hypothetical protein